VNGEWAWDVLVALHRGPLHYTILLNNIRAQGTETGWYRRKRRVLQDSPLNRTLRRLEQGELVTHVRASDFPYHATYRLSSAARELLTGAAPLVLWAETHADLLNRARQRRCEEALTR
jgi:DNA-binding HxlR family transcriptional regulator